MTYNQLMALAIVSGIAFGSMSWAYQMGRRLGISAVQIAFVATAFGSLFFWFYLMGQTDDGGAQGGSPWVAPALVWTLSLLGGAGQVITVLLLDPAQKHGPAAPVFCAVNLVFLPAALYAVGVLHESLAPLQVLGLAGALGCVVVAGKAQAADPPAAARDSRSIGDAVLYPLLLLGLMLGSSVASIVMKQLQAMPLGTGTLFDVHRRLYLFLLYASIGAGVGAISVRRGWTRSQILPAIGLGGAGAIGSVIGFVTLSQASALPGGIGFAVSNVMCFITIAAISAGIFKEKRNAAWYLTITLGIASVILFARG